MNRKRFWTRVVGLSLLLNLDAPDLPANAANVLAHSPTAASQTPTAAAGARKELFEHVSLLSGVPWTYLAAIDQYERNLTAVRKRPASPGLVGIYFAEADWTGLLNPDAHDTNPQSIALFNGFGRDGSGDGIADRSNDLDVLAAMSALVTKLGTRPEDVRISLWNYYQNARSVERIEQFARIYDTFGKLDLYERAFPLPLGADYSYRSTWGASRGWGGYRIHEGTDLFARSGVTVKSTCYGVIEEKGWNPYGGWRIGIRDLNNVYHYYAHLSGFQKGLREGDVVKPGQTLGWVGSSGYGKPGTSGKFPPHLHFGLYRDNGLVDWPFDPYPQLRKWEREERARAKTK
ncbi:M23 family metallopeptidase [Paenibacillus athensensis]|uniref:Peptidase M23 n=1 Tax=Paenibacillus athensensis TaxID=1967502 RepID=A0A4Y8Q786_9BACL|nr:M23 family metallopeptidase [Paenibacillus athensensis]MCD1259869.1 M23 family metallopeptidase [Paenibacillus athensensis]